MNGKIKGIHKNELAKNTVWMLIGFGFRILIQAGYFVVLARMLGADGFGSFVGVAALVMIAAQFSGLGTGNLLVKNVARNPKAFEVYWGNSLVITLLSSLLLIPLVLLVSSIILPGNISSLFVLLIAAADIIFLRVNENAAQAFQAFQKLSWTAFTNVQISTIKMIAAVGIMLMVKEPQVMDWGYAYLLCSIISAVISVVLVHTKLGKPRVHLAIMKPELKEGLYFAVGGASLGAYNETDKSLLTKLSSLEAAGIYGAANRIIDVTFTPIRSLLFAAYAKFFQHGEKGIKNSFQFTIKLLPLSTGYGIICGACIFLFAPIMPLVLGADFEASVEAVRWLSIVPLLKSFHYFAADSLTGAGYQGFRSLAQIGAAVVSIGLNMFLIPMLAWKGAAITAIITNTVLSMTMWTGILYLTRKKDQPVPEASASKSY
ncbi:oligosaccharide flippase family protein [Paenibacillus turpanensis]|uniref:oligosaccharide flippase family protein n=1 Tax=Paenibacillus turpanensis TaxID=2689078 RepID=UPI0014091063|nr:oligosaccharide flippase family protein [Paenibacillus turpanensis]